MDVALHFIPEEQVVEVSRINLLSIRSNKDRALAKTRFKPFGNHRHISNWGFPGKNEVAWFWGASLCPLLECLSINAIDSIKEKKTTANIRCAY
jgi:hypothetical protein